MNKHFFSICSVLVLFALFVRHAIKTSASFGFDSASGNYRLEYVRISPPFPFYELAYIMVSDQEDPEQVFGSPVADAESLEIRTIETRDEAGVSFLRFNKTQHRFNILIPGWEESFLNVFVTNTCVQVVEVDNPSRIYHSPLIKDSYVEMRTHESGKEVGIDFVRFDKVRHAFVLGVPQWREGLLNFFIGNTPYTVQPNG